MGAGNPLVRSFDEDMYSPKTYFIDFYNSYTEEEKMNAIKEEFDSNDLDGFDDLTEDEIEKEFYKIIEWDVESFQEDFFFNLDKPFENWFHKPDEDERLQESLSAAYRGYGVVLAMNDDCLVVTTTEAEAHHYPIGLVPNFKLEDIVDEYYYDNQEKEEWYEKRNLSFRKRCDDKGEEIYQKKLNKWLKEYEPFMKWFHSLYKEKLSGRTGPWTSCSLKVIGDKFEFL